MKKFMVSAIICLGLAFFPTDSFAQKPHKHRDGKGHFSHGKGKGLGHHKPDRKGSNTVGAPLDGGLSAILLGAAGAAFIARQRKKKMLSE